MIWLLLLSFWMGFCLCYTLFLLIEDYAEDRRNIKGLGTYLLYSFLLYLVLLVYYIPGNLYGAFRNYKIRGEIKKLDKSIEEANKQFQDYSANRDYN